MPTEAWESTWVKTASPSTIWGTPTPAPTTSRTSRWCLSRSIGEQTYIGGSLNSLPNATYTLDFYANAAADPSGYGEGQRYLGSTSVTTDAAGNASFSVTLPSATASGEWISATATDAGGNTSEFSLDTLATTAAPVTVQSTVVNGANGAGIQRSMVKSLVVTFSDDRHARRRRLCDH